MLQTTWRGGVAGAVATVVMTLEESLDKRLFDSEYDDVEILGKLVTRGDGWRAVGWVLHVQNGAILGAAYAHLEPSVPGPAVLRGLLVGLIEHVATSVSSPFDAPTERATHASTGSRRCARGSKRRVARHTPLG